MPDSANVAGETLLGLVGSGLLALCLLFAWPGAGGAPGGALHALLQRPNQHAEVVLALLSDPGSANFGSYIGGVQGDLQSRLSPACVSALQAEMVGVQIHIGKSGRIEKFVLNPLLKNIDQDMACIRLIENSIPSPAGGVPGPGSRH